MLRALVLAARLTLVCRFSEECGLAWSRLDKMLAFLAGCPSASFKR